MRCYNKGADTGDGLQGLAALFQRWVFGQEPELPFDGGDQVTEGGEGTAGFAFQERRAAQALFEGNACLTRAARL